ncbi:phage portal protein [Psychrobacillus sp. FJAT-21963]|uniref:phage tail assembly chaperone n=1 Tax=Psychrobacillus sp. FJAT-21963 TaxID=1712028 RepID=UPI0006FEC529|nr:phage portal protein [Psychrobacillus sp. FJAT-21963]KQL37125.1 phage portal protein [Psychrobacillus sp. FJAT-21963]
MSKLKAFLKGNVKQVENASLKLDRFDEAIILRPLASAESERIQEGCFQNKAGKKGKQERVFNVVKYNREICVASFVHPDLNSAELQEDYGVRGADNLYSNMFLAGEANQILEKVTEISGIVQDINEDIEEAKN